jgi:protein O-mannosyl-transferase
MPRSLVGFVRMPGFGAGKYNPVPRAQPAFAASRWALPLAGGLLVLAALVAYQNSFSVPFLFDDTAAIVDNPTIRHLWPIGEPLSPPGGLTVSGRPVLNLSFAVNHALGGLNVTGYHAVNLAIHILAGLTLFGLVRRTLELVGRRSVSAGDSPVTSRAIGGIPLQHSNIALLPAFAAAFLWVLHPLQTESVTYLVPRITHNFGYSRASFMRASSVVKRQLTGAPRLLRAASQAATS